MIKTGHTKGDHSSTEPINRFTLVEAVVGERRNRGKGKAAIPPTALLLHFLQQSLAQGLLELHVVFLCLHVWESCVQGALSSCQHPLLQLFPCQCRTCWAKQQPTVFCLYPDFEMQRIMRHVAHVQTGSELWCLVCLCSQFYSWSWLSSIAVLWFSLQLWFVSESEPRAHVNGICFLLRLSQIAVLPKEQLCATWNSTPSLPMKLFIPDDFGHGHVRCFLLTENSSAWTQASVFVNFLQKFQIYRCRISIHSRSWQISPYLQ